MNKDEIEMLQWKIDRDTSLLENGLEKKKITVLQLHGMDWTDEMLYAWKKGIVQGLTWVRDDMQKCIVDVKAGIQSSESVSP